jgi:hypothetical protein
MIKKTNMKKTISIAFTVIFLFSVLSTCNDVKSISSNAPLKMDSLNKDNAVLFDSGNGELIKDMAGSVSSSLGAIDYDNNGDPINIENSITEENQLLFDIIEITNLGQTADGISAADFNNDGWTDFIASSATVPWTLSRISIFYNNKNNTFIQKDIFIMDNETYDVVYISDVETGDFNNDGYIDIIFTYTEHNESYRATYGIISILLNNGSDEFPLEIMINRLGSGDPKDPEKRTNPKITSADYDNDGDIDFVVGDNSGKIEYYTNIGNATFISQGFLHDFGSASWGLDSEDFNDDGYIDLVVSAEESKYQGIVSIIYNNGNSNCFNQGPGVIIIHNYFSTACFDAFDYDNDGDLDILMGDFYDLFMLINKEGNYHVYFLCSLSKSNGHSEFLNQGGITSFDADQDGFIDLILGGLQGKIRCCINTFDTSAISSFGKPLDKSLYIFNRSITDVGSLPITTIIGNIAVEADVYGNIISSVEFYLDGILVYVDTEPPYRWVWDRYENPKSDSRYHDLKIIVFNDEGNPAPYNEMRVKRFL